MTSPLIPPPSLRAILGSTNTGKTHYAVERMLGRASGIIGLPLRLLAREVYDKICAMKGPKQCALITGEEKIVPPHARYYVCTVEAMPTEKSFAFVAIDEVQLMASPERGHIFTDRVLHFRGQEETLLLGASTIRPVLQDLIPKIRFDYRERFSTLSYDGATKITRLPKRSVIVAFSAREVYAIAELIRRFRGGAAVVMGGLSPRTRNAQAGLFQSGEVDFLVATDAVGMGLNLDTDHVAFSAVQKFDGRMRRALTPMEAGQIAGRAGRFRNNGTFGTTGECYPLSDDLVHRIENHEFEPLHAVEWRNSDLDFSTLQNLKDSLQRPRPNRRLRRVKGTVDEQAFERMSAISEVVDTINTPADVKRLWDVCQIPDFRNLTIDAHVRLLQDLYRLLIRNNGTLPQEYLNTQITRLDHIEGGVDMLSTRLAQIRTWTYCSNKTSWMQDAPYWIKHTRTVEDRLSDALHDNLVERFVDRRTHTLLKGMRGGSSMIAKVKDNGEVWVDDQKIGHLDGLNFKIETGASELETKALHATALKAVAPEIDRRLTSLCGGNHDIFTLSHIGEILWGGRAIGRIASSGSVFSPDTELIGGEMGNENLQHLARDRMRDFLRSEIAKKLQPLTALKTLSDDETMPALSRGLAYSLLQENGSLNRAHHFKTLREMEQDSRKPLRDIGVVFGHYNVFMPEMLKPKPATLLSILLAYGAGGHKKPFIPFAGVTSLANDGDFNSTLFTPDAIASAGYRACGPRIIRFDILNRLSQFIRQAQSQNKITSGGRKFQVMQEMLAILGATYEETCGVLENLGYTYEIREPVGKVETDTLAEKTDSATTTQNITDPDPAIEKAETVESTTEPRSVDPIPASQIATSDASPVPPSDSPASAATSAAVGTETDAPKKPKNKKYKSKKPRPLNVYNKRETREDGTAINLENTEFWFLPHKKNRTRPKNNSQAKTTQIDQKFAQFQQDNEFKGKSRKSKKPYGNKNKSGKKSGNNNHIENETRRMEDSPFAALAALKNPKGKS